MEQCLNHVEKNDDNPDTNHKFEMHYFMFYNHAMQAEAEVHDIEREFQTGPFTTTQFLNI